MKKTYLVILTVTAGLFTSCAFTNNVKNKISDKIASTTAAATPEASAVPKISVTNTATKIEGEPNMVISPYKPYNKIDIKGYKTGDKVGDPSTLKADPTTGKADMSTLKAFVIP